MTPVLPSDQMPVPQAIGLVGCLAPRSTATKNRKDKPVSLPLMDRETTVPTTFLPHNSPSVVGREQPPAGWSAMPGRKAPIDPANARPDERHHYFVRIADLSIIPRLCKECATVCRVVSWEPTQEQLADTRFRNARFDDLGDIAKTLDIRTGSALPTLCTRCTFKARAPWSGLGYSAVSPSGTDGHRFAMDAIHSTRNVMADKTTPPDDALFSAGQLMISAEALKAAGIKAGDTAIQWPRLASHYFRHYLKSHMLGDFGTVGQSEPGIEDDSPLASRLCRNVASIVSGRGDVVSRFPIAPARTENRFNETTRTRETVQIPPVDLVNWTSFGSDPSKNLTLLCLSSERVAASIV